ncbi:hypothetical protein MMC34_001204 [Xylographa carneopallida]|nr:hypothetical protein [Xylographa carneopallida]
MSSKLSSSLPPAGSSSSSGLMAHSSSRPSIADRVGARTARARPWLQSSSPAPIERPARVPAFRGTRKGPYLSDRTFNKQSDTTVRQSPMSSRPRATVSRVTPPAPILAVSQPQGSRWPLTKRQPDIAGPRTSVLSGAPATVNTPLEHFDPFLDLAIRESKTTRNAPPTYESVMARLAERKAAKASQTAAALKPSAPLPSRQLPPRRAPSTTSTVSSRSTQRVSSNTSTVSSTSTQFNREMSPIAWQLLLPKIRAATPLPAPQPITPATPPPAPQTLKVAGKLSRKQWDTPLPTFKTGKVYKPCSGWHRHRPENKRLPRKSCLKSGSQLTKAKKSIRWQEQPAATVVVVSRWISPEDCHENWEPTCGKLRRFNEHSVSMTKEDGAFTHEYCECTMNVLQLTPEKHLPFYADAIITDCCKRNLDVDAVARMCSIADGTGIEN